MSDLRLTDIRITHRIATLIQPSAIGPSNEVTMLYELRVYECFAGKLPDLHRRFANHTMKLFEKYGIKNIGYWTTDVGPNSNELTYLLGFKDANHRMEAWKSFRADPEWQKVVEESHRNGIIVRNVRNQLLSPTDYSPMK